MNKKFKLITLITMILLLSSITSVVAHPEVEYDFKFGSFGSSDGLFDRPVDIEIHEESIYVSDNGNDRIQVFDLEGNFISKIGESGAGVTQLEFPGQLAINETHIHVADFNNGRVQIYDLEGNHAGTIGEAELSGPWGIATDNNHIYVGDFFAQDIKMYEMGGNLVKTFNLNLNAVPYMIDINSDNLFVVGSGTDSGVDIYDLAGNHIQTIMEKGEAVGARGIHITENRIYVSDWSLDRIITNDHEYVHGTFFGTSGNEEGEFNEPYGIGSSDTHIYLADSANNRIQAYQIIPEVTTVTVTETETETETEGITDTIPLDLKFVVFALLVLVPMQRYLVNRSKYTTLFASDNS